MAFLSPVDEEAVETAMVRAGRERAGDGWEAYLRLIDEDTQQSTSQASDTGLDG